MSIQLKMIIFIVMFTLAYAGLTAHQAPGGYVVKPINTQTAVSDRYYRF